MGPKLTITDMLYVPSKVPRAHHAVSSQQANQVDTMFSNFVGKDIGFSEIKWLIQLITAVVAELGLRAGSNSDAYTSKRRGDQK